MAVGRAEILEHELAAAQTELAAAFDSVNHFALWPVVSARATISSEAKPFWDIRSCFSICQKTSASNVQTATGRHPPTRVGAWRNNHI